MNFHLSRLLCRPWTLLRIGLNTMLGAITGLMLGIATQSIPASLLLGVMVGGGTGAALERQHRRAGIDLEQCLWACTPLLVFVAITLMIGFDIRLW